MRANSLSWSGTSLESFNSKIDLIQETHILDIYFIPHSNGSIFEWMNSLAKTLAIATPKYCSISIVSAWISYPFLENSVHDQCRLYLQKTLSEYWNFCIRNYSLTNFGLKLFGTCWCVQLQWIGTTDIFDHEEEFYNVSIGCVMF